jgi:isopentenyldiphosphate isomerase
LTKIRMQYGLNDNEISLLYRGIVDPTKVTFDPVEIESIEYLSMEKIDQILKEQETAFCGWFVELWHAYKNEPAQQLQVLETYTGW